MRILPRKGYPHSFFGKNGDGILLHFLALAEKMSPAVSKPNKICCTAAFIHSTCCSVFFPRVFLYMWVTLCSMWRRRVHQETVRVIWDRVAKEVENCKKRNCMLLLFELCITQTWRRTKKLKEKNFFMKRVAAALPSTALQSLGFVFNKTPVLCMDSKQ